MNIEKYTEELITLRHYFHQHPELALQEVETSAYIRKYLEKLGYEIVPIEPTGLIAELPSLRNREKLVVLRAEMDALPIQEQTNLPYASVNQGCMHACGHDMILAAALSVLEKSVSAFSKMPVDELQNGIGVLGAILGEIAVFSMLSNPAEHVLSTATASDKPREGIDFFPLSVEYNEKLMQ